MSQREYQAERLEWYLVGVAGDTLTIGCDIKLKVPLEHLIYDGKKGWVSGYSQCQTFKLVAQKPVTEDRPGLQSIVEVTKNQGKASIEAREKLMTDDQLKHIRALIKALEASPWLKADDPEAARATDAVWHEKYEPRAAKAQGCPKCGHAGDFVRMALVCPDHGAFGGC